MFPYKFHHFEWATSKKWIALTLKNSVKLTLWIFKLRNLEKYLHLNLSAVNMYAKLRNQVFFYFLFVCFVFGQS